VTWRPTFTKNVRVISTINKIRIYDILYENFDLPFIDCPFALHIKLLVLMTIKDRVL